ncbi:hypothetical protein, partial [Gardnerella sp. 30-4]|uniref:hypothetical protein n=1 Tax=Gardnerella sp. 30-4 TaxID=1840518 RepID=UPI001E509BF6
RNDTDLRKRLSAQTPLAAAKNGARGLSTSQHHFEYTLFSVFTRRTILIENNLFQLSCAPQFRSMSKR